ncbi:MAG: hypothetical protein U0269_21555 [Polyangiales bacterium]
MRVMLYDPTCVRSLGRPGLSKYWRAGSVLYGSVLRRFDAWRAVRSWDEGLRWIANLRPSEPIDEVQYWGHGKWGCALIDRDLFDERALVSSHPLNPSLRAIAARMRGRDALFWFRTCETLGADVGHRFARDLADTMGCRVAGHTFVIGALQSGLHSLSPGASPHWDAAEGLAEGTPSDPRRAHASSWRAPNTIHCLQGAIPPRW